MKHTLIIEFVSADAASKPGVMTAINIDTDDAPHELHKDDASKLSVHLPQDADVEFTIILLRSIPCIRGVTRVPTMASVTPAFAPTALFPAEHGED